MASLQSQITEADKQAYQKYLDNNLRAFRNEISECAKIYANNMEMNNEIPSTRPIFEDYAQSGDAKKLQASLKQIMPKNKDLKRLSEHALDAETAFAACKNATNDEERKRASEALAEVGQKINITAKANVDPQVKTNLGKAVACILIAAMIGLLLGGPIVALVFASIPLGIILPNGIPYLDENLRQRKTATLDNRFFTVPAEAKGTDRSPGFTPMADKGKMAPSAQPLKQGENSSKQQPQENIPKPK